MNAGARVYGTNDRELLARARERPCPVTSCGASAGEPCRFDAPSDGARRYAMRDALHVVHAERIETLCPSCGAEMLRVHPCPECKTVSP